MRRRFWGVVICTLWIGASVADARVVGTAVSDANGGGTIEFTVDPKLNPQDAADQITDNLALTNGALPQSVVVKNCHATVAFANGVAGKKVEAEIPDQVADRLGECVAGAGAAGGGGISVPAIIGGAAVVGGGIAGGIIASGSDNKSPTGEIGPPPVIPPPPAVQPTPRPRPPLPPPPPEAGGPQPPTSPFK